MILGSFLRLKITFSCWPLTSHNITVNHPTLLHFISLFGRKAAFNIHTNVKLRKEKMKMLLNFLVKNNYLRSFHKFYFSNVTVKFIICFNSFGCSFIFQKIGAIILAWHCALVSVWPYVGLKVCLFPKNVQVFTAVSTLNVPQALIAKLQQNNWQMYLLQLPAIVVKMMASLLHTTLVHLLAIVVQLLPAVLQPLANVLQPLAIPLQLLVIVVQLLPAVLQPLANVLDLLAIPLQLLAIALHLLVIVVQLLAAVLQPLGNVLYSLANVLHH